MAYEGWQNRETFTAWQWMASDEPIYRKVVDLLRRTQRSWWADRLEELMRQIWPDGKTPDGERLDLVNWNEVADQLEEAVDPEGVAYESMEGEEAAKKLAERQHEEIDKRAEVQEIIDHEEERYKPTGEYERKAFEIWQKEYGDSRNFMTPDPIGYGWIGKTLVYEIAEGTGFNQEPIFGVSIVRIMPDGSVQSEHDLANVFPSEQDARSYISELRHTKPSIQVEPGPPVRREKEEPRDSEAKRIEGFDIMFEDWK